MNSMSRISRRTALKGLGVLLPLPALEAFGQDRPPVKPPVRLVWITQANGMYPSAWNPEGNGRDFTLSRTLKPFEKFKDRMTVLRNIRTFSAGPHIGKVTSFLTGVQARRDPKVGTFSCAKSVDQWIADREGRETLLASIQLGIEHPGQGYCSGADSPISYGATFSWGAPARRLMPEIRPRAAFEMLFGQTGPEAEARARARGSILDLVRDQAADIRRRGSSVDKRKIDEYLESVRSVERRLKKTMNPPARRWTPPTKPQKLEAPAPGLPAARAEHVRLMFDLITLALWTDTTRVATYILANSLSDADFSFIDGVHLPFHSGCSHHQDKPDKGEQYARINEWHAGQVARFLERLDGIDEGGRSLLDNCVIGFGSELKDGHRHENFDLPIALFGGGGGAVKHRGHLRCPEDTNIADLHLTTFRWFGIEAESFNGVSTKVIPELL